MDDVHIHLLLTHAPIMGYAVGLGFLIYGYAVKSEITRKGALWLFLILTPVTMLVSHSGEESEERVEHLPGVEESYIEEHEDAAGPAVVSTWILGALSLGVLLFGKRNEKIIQYGTAAALINVAVTCGLMGYTGYLGGQIRHTEIRSNTSQAPASESPEQKHSEDEEHH